METAEELKSDAFPSTLVQSGSGRRSALANPSSSTDQIQLCAAHRTETGGSTAP